MAKRRDVFVDTKPALDLLSRANEELSQGARPVAVAMLKPIVAALRNTIDTKVTARTGLLGVSVEQKVKVYQSGRVVWAAAGIAKDYYTMVGKNKPRVSRPSKYAHLVDGGTKPHTITFQSRKGTTQHPGSRAVNFRAAAIASSQGASLAAGQKALDRLLAKALKGK